MSYLEKIDKTRLPRHIAIIMDGNGRWAKERGYERIFGHQAGVESVRQTTEAAAEIGVEYLTLYAFSTENWERPQAEVDALMSLLVDSIQRETPTLNKNNIRLAAIGNLNRLPAGVREKLQACISETAKNTGLTLVLALSYSARWEIVNAVREICEEVERGDYLRDEIDDRLFAQRLTTRSIPDPDLMIRTSGELRISNFLLWQLAYAELYFTPVHWPDFRKDDLYRAIYEFQRRERRFGK
ncbi:MAG: isoprenyl transferase [Prevotellaceae bacterium]|jgi:undecaprenyl diphosphate synthase|nr:isoprenyl transferase [Prevotellaceae bacterium]